jgi:hypothetical protein
MNFFVALVCDVAAAFGVYAVARAFGTSFNIGWVGGVTASLIVHAIDGAMF